MEDTLESEQAFLQKNYPDLAEVNGPPFLSRSLNKVRGQIKLQTGHSIQKRYDYKQQCSQTDILYYAILLDFFSLQTNF